MQRTTGFRNVPWKFALAAGILASLALGASGTAEAGPSGCQVDQAHTLTPNITTFASNRVQSFLPTRSQICGASIRVADGIGTMGDITLELWDRLPNDGGHMLRSGTVPDVRPGDGWISVDWETARIDPTRHHFLIAKCTDSSMGLSFDAMNRYPRGNLFVGDDYTPFPTWDLSFEIFADFCASDVSQTIDSGLVVPVSWFEEVAQSFRPTRASIGGLRLKAWSSGFFTLEVWDGLPSLGGAVRLASVRTYQDVVGEWAHVEWKPVPVTPGEEYFLVVTPDEGQFAEVAYTLFDAYPDGTIWAEGTPFGDSDFAFEVLSCGPGCASGNVNQTGEEVLRVNGQTSPDGAWVPVPFDAGLLAQISKPSSGGNGKFVLHANWGAPTSETEVSLPGQIGTSCYPMLLPSAGGTAAPAAVWNNIGKEDKVGSSVDFDGSALPDPPRAPTFFWALPSGDPTLFPVGTVVTLQGVIIDPNTGANKPVSLTNAVVLAFE